MKSVFWFMYDFILWFLVFYIFCRVFLNKKKTSYSKLKKNDVTKLFIDKYNLDVKKIGFKKILNIVTMINRIIISFTSTLILRIDNIFVSVIVCFIVIIMLVYSLFEIAARYLKKLEVK